MNYSDMLVCEEVAVESMFLDDMLLECANECLRLALENGRHAEVPFYKKALDYAASAKLDRMLKDAPTQLNS